METMETLPNVGGVCSSCGTVLNASGSCLACLLRGGMEEPAETAEPAESQVDASPAYGDFEVARREDGSLWELGRGAMGVTFKAVDRVLHRAVALKVVQLGPVEIHDRQRNAAVRERFLREARAAAALRHANVAGIYQFGASEHADRCFYAMELVEGETLEARVQREGPLDAPTALEVARQVCAALVAAADRGLIHRDLKPGNLMLTSAGGGSAATVEVKVIDFGLAKAVATAGEADLTEGGFVGTPAYASPEQFAREPVDARSDLYSLGLTLWYALTGRAPFSGRTAEEVRHHPARSKLPVEQLHARKVPPPMVALLRRLLAVELAERPANPKQGLAEIEACRRRIDPRLGTGSGRGRAAAGWIMAAALALAAAGTWWKAIRPAPERATGSVITEKSLAVLPFDNFSPDKENAYFADGIQDEVLTDLAKVADLKVISRTSVMPYKDAGRRGDVREIGRSLGVAYVVEGSVRRAGSKVRVTAQLIDARTDAHKWAEQYDGDLSDIFSIQSQMARQIADALHSQLSPAEKAGLAEQPTDDLEAYQLYTEATEIFVWDDMQNAVKSITRKVELLEEAIQRDPRFVLAYCALAKTQCEFCEMEGGVHLSLAKRAAETALQLRPDMGEPHRALAFCYIHENDYDRAHTEITAALRTLPNDATAFQIAGMIDERQNRWNDAVAKLQKAFELDPKNEEVAFRLAEVYHLTRREREKEQLLKTRVPRNQSEHYWIQIGLAEVKLDIGDPAAARALLEEIPLDFNPTAAFRYVRLKTLLFLRDYEAITQMMAATPANIADGLFGGTPPESWTDGLLAHLRGNEPKAQAIFAALRQKLDFTLGDGQKDEEYFDTAAGLDARLGRKEQAIREARQAAALMPVTKDAMQYPDYVAGLAFVYAWTGEKDLALEQLKFAAKLPAGPSYGDLRLSPGWEPLQGDPRFEAIVASLAPK